MPLALAGHVLLPATVAWKHAMAPGTPVRACCWRQRELQRGGRRHPLRGRRPTRRLPRHVRTARRGDGRGGRRGRAGAVVGTTSVGFYFGLRLGETYVDPAPLLGRYRYRPRLVPLDGGARRAPPPPRA